MDDRERQLNIDANLKCQKCPMFIRTAKGPRIVCRGMLPHTTVSVCFRTPGARLEYMDDFCNTDRCWQGCGIYQLAAEGCDEE